MQRKSCLISKKREEKAVAYGKKAQNSSSGSPVSFSAQYNANGGKQNPDVEPKGCAFDIFGVEDGFVFVVEVISAVDLGVARDAGAHGEHAKATAHIVALGFVQNEGTITDKGHFTDEYAPDLWKFIEGELAHKATDTCQVARSILEKRGREVVGCFGIHRTELQAGEGFAALSYSVLSEDDRAFGVKLYGYGKNKKYRGQKKKHQEGCDDIEGAFYKTEEKLFSLTLLKGANVIFVICICVSDTRIEFFCVQEQPLLFSLFFHILKNLNKREIS